MLGQSVGGRGVPVAGGNNCGGVPGGPSSVGCGGVPGGATIVANLSPGNSSFGSSGPSAVTRYNDQYAGVNGLANNGRYTSGDTRAYTVLSNGTVVGTINDGAGGSNIGSGVGRNVAVQTITNNSLQEATLNSFDDYGTESCIYNGAAGSNSCNNVAGSWTDSSTWKTGGIWARGSNLYLAVYRQVDTQPFTGYNSSILLSNDNGVHWCNPSHESGGTCTDPATYIAVTAAGSGGTNGTFSWTSTGGTCTTQPAGQFTVASGAISSATITTAGNCIGTSTVPTVTGYGNSSGLTGATLTLTMASLSSLTADVPPSAQQMWTSTLIRAPQEIYYCQAQSSCAVVDSNSTYAYLTTMDQSEQHLYLMRIAVGSDFQNAANYQYSTGPNTWTSTIASAVPIIAFGNAHTGFLASQVVYDYSLGQYIEMANTGGGNVYGEIAAFYAPHPWGPWTIGSLTPNKELLLGFTALLTNTRSVTSGNCVQYTLGADGDYTYQNATYPLVNNYSTQLQKANLCLGYTPANPGTTGISTTNLYQEFQFAPSTAGNIPDSSGNGHNGTPTEFPGWSSQGDATFYGATTTNYDVDTGDTYTGTNFTITVVFRHHAQPIGYEKLFGNPTSAGAAGSMVMQRDSSTADQWQVIVDTASTSSDLTLPDDAWNEVVIVRNGTTVTIYDANSFTTSTATPIATFTTGSDAQAGDILIGNGASATATYFDGEVAYWNNYHTNLSTPQLVANQNIIWPLMAARGIYLARAQQGTEQALDPQVPYAAWSLRKLRQNYAGNAVNVTRASDSTSTDIGFSGTDFNTAALNTFCAGTTCTVNTWYDQSGNAFNAACVGSPVIYTAGAAITSGGHTGIQFNGSTQYCQTGSGFYYFGIYGSASAVLNFNASAESYAAGTGWIASGILPQNANQNAIPIQKSATNTFWSARNGTTLPPANSFTYGSPSIFSASYGSYIQRANLDGGTQVTNTVTTGTGTPSRFYLTAIQLGNDANPSSDFYGIMSEQIMFPYALSTEGYANLRTNQKNYYGTP